MKLKIPFIDKYYKGSYIGGLLETYNRAASIIGIVQFLSVMVVLYTTTARPIMDRYLPWFTFPMYIVTLLVGVILLMVVVQLVVMPSAYTFFNRQFWSWNNPMRTKLEEIEKNQKRIMEKLGIDDDKS